MGALFSVVSDPVPQIASVIFDNLDAVINSRGSEMLKSWFSSFTDARKGWDAELYRSKAVKILSLLKQCGIQQSTAVIANWALDQSISEVSILSIIILCSLRVKNQ